MGHGVGSLGSVVIIVTVLAAATILVHLARAVQLDAATL